LSLALLFVIFFSSCLGPASGESAPASESAPGSAESEPVSETEPVEAGSERLTPEGTYLPPEDWSGGELYPYPAIFPYRFEGETPEQTMTGSYFLFGLADAEGRIVTDPYFSDYEIVTSGDGSRFLLLSRYKSPYLAWLKKQLYGLTSMDPPETEVMILEKNGLWSTSFGSEAVYLGENRLLLIKDTLREIYRTDGSLLLAPWNQPTSAAASVEIPYGYFSPFSSSELAFSSGFLPVCGLTPEGDDGNFLYNFIDAEGNLLLKKNCRTLASFDPYGLAAVQDPETGLYGVIDSSGGYLLGPSYVNPLSGVTRDLYSFTEDGTLFGLLRASTGDTVFPAKFWNIPAQPEDPNGFVWLSPETNLYPWSVETGERVPLPRPLADLPGSSAKRLFTPLAGDWYFFYHGDGMGHAEYVLFRYADPEAYRAYPASDFFEPFYDAAREKIVLMRREDAGFVEHALFFDPVTGEESEPDHYYYLSVDRGDGLFQFRGMTADETPVSLFVDAEGRRFFEEDSGLIFAKSAGGGLFACAAEEASSLCRRDGTVLLSLPPEEVAVEEAG
ncbi:MAG: hypothetical protein IKX85_03390, partial [Clostridia bacterium]|nr:hypothetical protein [Clostridia bacterium]